MKEQFLSKSLRKQDIQSIYNRCHIIEHFICKTDKRFTRMVNTVVGGGGRGRQGWHGGESTRLQPMWPRFQSWRRSHMWVEFVVGSLLYFDTYFSGYPGFAPTPAPPLLKNQHLANSNSIWNARTRFKEFLRTPKCFVGKQITNYNFFKLF